MKQWKNFYKGQRCFVLGNGPSLAKMNRLPLRNEITFGTNSVALLFQPRHMVLCAKTVVADESWMAAARLGVSLAEHSFITKRMSKLRLPSKDVTVFQVGTHGSWFSGDPIKRPFCKIHSSGTVMQQMAVYMGCNPIYLIGFDGGYVPQKKGQPDPNHFVPEYWGPDLKTINEKRAKSINESSLAGHKLAKEYCDAHGIEIYNATPGGVVEVFERVDYDSIFAG